MSVLALIGVLVVSTGSIIRSNQGSSSGTSGGGSGPGGSGGGPGGSSDEGSRGFAGTVRSFARCQSMYGTYKAESVGMRSEQVAPILVLKSGSLQATESGLSSLLVAYVALAIQYSLVLHDTA